MNETLGHAQYFGHDALCCAGVGCLNINLTPSFLHNDITAVHPVSILILHSREIQQMWLRGGRADEASVGRYTWQALSCVGLV